VQISQYVNEVALDSAFRTYIERRLQFALSRYGGRVGDVAVRVSSDGRALSRCRITVDVVPFGRVSVDEAGPDLFAAIDRAGGRLGRIFGRELGRLRDARFGRESVRTAA
jgi:ribosome-associated translation inhibitor RaiA